MNKLFVIMFLITLISCSSITNREKQRQAFSDCISRFFAEGMKADEASKVCEKVYEREIEKKKGE